MVATGESGDIRIAIVGLGYVGLPLAVEFGKRHGTLGFDILPARVEELRRGEDRTLEVSSEELAQAVRLRYSHDEQDLRDCNIFIVTVPTPIDTAKRPDLTPLQKASEVIGRALKPGDTVIYESTVYPGCTEEVCVPILERVSGLRYEAASTPVGADPVRDQTFAIGYSPERINPGDKAHRVTTI